MNDIPEIFRKHYQQEISESQILENSQKTVVVGMSGGVDSSVCALVCKLLGYKTIGIFMKNWEETGEDGVCTSEADYQDVVKVCEHLEIPYYSVNFSKEYKDHVFDHFISEYQAGHTPNPDILCNREIKFKVFFDKAMELGADFLATGHYCQTQDGQLLKGADSNKDQTYFLYTIKSNILEKVLFPVGHMQKTDVRALARGFNLPTHAKKDSTGICFIGERNFKDFLSNYIEKKQGQFIHLDTGLELGHHDGVCFYTPGQRKGMGIGGPGGPWFVSHKDTEKNIVYVVEGEEHPALYADYLIADNLSWVASAPEFPISLKAKIRYRQKDASCKITQVESGLKVEFDNPQRAIALRQSIVFYQGNVCLGGGMIKEIAPSYYERGITLTSI